MRSDGFSLLVAVCNAPVDRERYLDVLAESLPGTPIHRVRFTAETLDPLAETLAQISGKPPGAVALLDLERAVPSSAEYHPVLATLNLQRQLWVERLPQPVVMWVSDYLLAFLGREAPDFMDRRSGTLWFPDSTGEGALPFRSDAWDHGKDTAFSRDQRLKRVTELRARLHANEGSDDRVALRASAEWWTELGNHLKLLGETASALDAHTRALRIGEQIADDEIMTGAHANLGSLMMVLGQEDRAEDHVRTALEWSRSAGHADGEIKALVDLGRLAMHRGELHAAEQAFVAAAATMQRVGRHDRLADIYCNMALGRMERVTGDRAENVRTAEQLFRQALAIVRRDGRPVGEATVLNNLGVLFLERGELDRAEGAYRAALRIGEAVGHVETQANATGNLGNVAHKRADLEAAQAHYEHALSLAVRLGDPVGQARTHANLATVLRERGSVANSIRHLEQARDLFRSAGRSADAARIDARLKETPRQAG